MAASAALTAESAVTPTCEGGMISRHPQETLSSTLPEGSDNRSSKRLRAINGREC